MAPPSDFGKTTSFLIWALFRITLRAQFLLGYWIYLLHHLQQMALGNGIYSLILFPLKA
ncbi:sensor histidine kinase [Sesbania bispinosa]|nr:sensor histidine kinase [Sesbania bispinosa]